MNTAKTTFIRARIEPKLKRDAERVLQALGMNTTGAITVFLTQVSLQKGLPFAVNIPNKTTVRALNETLKLNHAYKNADEMLSDILNSK
ncbi:MAG: type II toxin-antitoxin system RelB/DinJ family antitoxin [bacterium]|nr:type II toxin-antitoxin system RelB/DinJ family antitoxin [bacterium]